MLILVMYVMMGSLASGAFRPAETRREIERYLQSCLIVTGADSSYLCDVALLLARVGWHGGVTILAAASAVVGVEGRWSRWCGGFTCGGQPKKENNPNTLTW